MLVTVCDIAHQLQQLSLVNFDVQYVFQDSNPGCQIQHMTNSTGVQKKVLNVQDTLLDALLPS